MSNVYAISFLQAKKVEHLGVETNAVAVQLRQSVEHYVDEIERARQQIQGKSKLEHPHLSTCNELL